MSTENYLRELRWKEINALRAENAKLREALERTTQIDGIEARDCTIKLIEDRLQSVEAQVAKMAEALGWYADYEG